MSYKRLWDSLKWILANASTSDPEFKTTPEAILHIMNTCEETEKKMKEGEKRDD